MFISHLMPLSKGAISHFSKLSASETGVVMALERRKKCVAIKMSVQQLFSSFSALINLVIQDSRKATIETGRAYASAGLMG